MKKITLLSCLVFLGCGVGKEDSAPSEGAARPTPSALSASGVAVRPVDLHDALRGVPDASAIGPYAVGHTSSMIFDPSRDGGRPDDSTYAATGRPIYYSVYYPAEPRDTHRARPAVYSLDPYYGQLSPASSLDFEAQGIDPAFEGPRPAHRRWPVVLFSPGWGASDVLHISFGTRLASHGYVVVIPYHFGDQLWPWEPLYDNIAVAAWDRPRDLAVILDDVLARDEAAGDLLHGRIQRNQVVAGGWSLGGYAAITLHSGDDSVCDTFFGSDVTDPPSWTCAATPPSPLANALVLFDASSWALHFDELQRVEMPALAMGQSWDALLAFDPSLASWQARQHAGLSGHPNYRVDVKGAIHASFSDFCELARAMKLKDYPTTWAGPWDDVLAAWCGPDVIPSPTAHRLMTSYAIAFLETTVAHEPGYREVLTPGYAVAHEPDVEFFRRERCEPPVPTPDWPPDWVYYQHMPPLHGGSDDQCP